MSEEELAYSEEYSKVIYVQPECEKVVKEEAVMKDGTWYGRNDEKTSVVKITVKDHAVTETTVVSDGSDGDAYNRCQKVASNFLTGRLHKAESILFRCTKIRKSKSA